ncbi:hypothetical protein DAMA08_004490 [Martiniozyma asiatica (nom. inval.)]|nr:hypothetical protein DAMA08_004490 [Martiniozyma asiatica]
MTADTLTEFLNSNFVSIDSISNVSLKIKDVNYNRKHSTSSNTNSDDLINPPVIDKLKYILSQELSDSTYTQSLSDIDALLGKYGRLPAITYTRDIVIQKMTLLKKIRLKQSYHDLSAEINDFEKIDLAKIKDSSFTKDQILNIVDKLASLRQSIDTLDVVDDGNGGDEENSHNLYIQLQDVVYNHLRPILQGEFSNSVKGWDVIERENKSQQHDPSFFTTNMEKFKQLLKCQYLSTKSESIDNYWAVDALLDNFKVKFVYHFEGDNSETNRIDKPDFPLNYTIGYITNNFKLANKFWMKSFKDITKRDEFSNSFIFSILKILKGKFKPQLKEIISNKFLLSYFVKTLKKFDETIIGDFNYSNVHTLTNDLILSNENIWNSWLSNEKIFVNLRYEEINDDKDAFKIEYDVVDYGTTKPTKIALNLKNLLEGITDSYSTLPVKYQMKFLNEVQLKLLNFYFSKIKHGLNALSPIKSIAVEGVSSLERICRIYCSSQFLIESMSLWSEEILFINLWHSLNKNDNFQSTFFESVINGYQVDIIDKIPKLLKSYFDLQLNRSMKFYFQNNVDWTLHENELNLSDKSQLEMLIKNLGADLKYIKSTVSSATFLEWKLLLSISVANYLENNIALTNKFSIAGAAKLRDDVQFVFESLDLVKDFKNYGKLMEILDVYEGKYISGNIKEYDLNIIRQNCL